MSEPHRRARRGALLSAVGGGLLLAAATPPAWVPGAEFLVVPGLMMWFSLATTAVRPYRDSYLLGCVHMAFFSWSLQHLMWAAYLLVVVLGGLYFVLGTAMVRAVPKRCAAVAFAVAVAASFWLRAVMPEIYYPHGQPCHCLWQWPALLGAVSLGGEVFANALLAALAAALLGIWRSWRSGVPRWGAAVTTLAAVGALVTAATVGGWWVHAAHAPALPERLSIAAVEPGIHPSDPYEGLPRAEQWPRFRELFAERLLQPTRELLASNPALDLVLWPESSVPEDLASEDVEAGRARVLPHWLPASTTRLLAGGNLRRDGRVTPAAWLVALPDGRVLGHQEKRLLVPGGEFVPMLAWLPAALGRIMHDVFEQALGGSAPDCVPGRQLPPLRTAGGVPFGVLLCYDNAFPGPGEEQVAAGARCLCALSNEAWFRGGDELVQLAAMTVCRALELATPVVRCTTDGWSLAVDAEGRLLAWLPMAPTPTPAARILRVELPLGAGRVPPLAWLRAAAGPAAALLLALTLLHAAFRWARLRVARTARPTAGGTD
ncbi:MAG: apolipoprotein N-acyltransferase [Planctomycetota bacterium]